MVIHPLGLSLLCGWSHGWAHQPNMLLSLPFLFLHDNSTLRIISLVCMIPLAHQQNVSFFVSTTLAFRIDRLHNCILFFLSLPNVIFFFNFLWAFQVQVFRRGGGFSFDLSVFGCKKVGGSKEMRKYNCSFSYLIIAHFLIYPNTGKRK